MTEGPPWLKPFVKFATKATCAIVGATLGTMAAGPLGTVPGAAIGAAAATAGDELAKKVTDASVDALADAFAEGASGATAKPRAASRLREVVTEALTLADAEYRRRMAGPGGDRDLRGLAETLPLAGLPSFEAQTLEVLASLDRRGLEDWLAESLRADAGGNLTDDQIRRGGAGVPGLCRAGTGRPLGEAA